MARRTTYRGDEPKGRALMHGFVKREVFNSGTAITFAPLQQHRQEFRPDANTVVVTREVFGETDVDVCVKPEPLKPELIGNSLRVPSMMVHYLQAVWEEYPACMSHIQWYDDHTYFQYCFSSPMTTYANNYEYPALKPVGSPVHVPRESYPYPVPPGTLDYTHYYKPGPDGVTFEMGYGESSDIIDRHSGGTLVFAVAYFSAVGEYVSGGREIKFHTDRPLYFYVAINVPVPITMLVRIQTVGGGDVLVNVPIEANCSTPQFITIGPEYFVSLGGILKSISFSGDLASPDNFYVYISRITQKRSSIKATIENFTRGKGEGVVERSPFSTGSAGGRWYQVTNSVADDPGTSAEWMSAHWPLRLSTAHIHSKTNKIV